MSDEERKSEERQAYLKEHYSKITNENYDEFIDWCIDDVYSQQSDEAKRHLRKNPPDDEFYIRAHFGACLTIRNMYLWHRDFSGYGEVDVDYLSHLILERAIEKILNEKTDLGLCRDGQ